VTLTRRLWERATKALRMPGSLRAVVLYLWQRADWQRGETDRPISLRIIVRAVDYCQRTVQRGISWLCARGLLRVVDRDNLGTYYSFDLPDDLRRAWRLPTRAQEEFEQLVPWQERPESKGVLGRLVELAEGIVASVEEALAPEEQPADLREPQPAYVTYVGRPNAEPPPLDETTRRAIWQQFTGEVPAARPARITGPDVDPALHPDARQVGALYESRGEATEVRERARRAREPDGGGPGDEAPHRRVLLEYRRAYSEATGHPPSVPMGGKEHAAIKHLLDRFGLDGALKLVGGADWVSGYIGLWDLSWSIRMGWAK